jgi:YD repeat-containing protein
VIKKLGQRIGFLVALLRVIRKPVPGMPDSVNGGIRAAAYVLLSFCSMTPALADVQYVYDESDRLVELIDASGNSAQYRYDASGNIEAILRYAAGEVAIAEFTPNQGPVGTTVTIYGVGFNATPANNTVRFNGIAATVSSASNIKLVIKVPTGATTGPISVTVGTQTATSASSFIVTTGALNAPPSITGFTPTKGIAGTAVTINGNNFDTLPANNTIWFNTALAPANSSSKTQISATVPSGATSGRIKVRTPYGTAISNADFIIPPTNTTLDQIGVTGRIQVNGPPLSVTIGTAGQFALVLFDGTKGQNLNLVFTNDTIPGTTSFYVYKPDGTQLGNPYSLSYTSGSPTRLSVDLTNLPATGTYSVLIKPPATAVGSIDVRIWEEKTGALSSANNNSAAISLEAGQNGRYSFSGTAGQGIGLGVTNLAMTPSGSLTLKVYKPDGSQLYTCSMSSSALGGSCDPNPVSPQTLLPVDGTYTVFVDPGSAAATLTLWLTADKTGTLTPEVTQTFTSTRVGQNARYSFSGTAGQNLSLGFTGDTFPGTTSFYVYKPDGTQLTTTSLYYSGSGNSVRTSLDLINLPANGTYRVFVTPSGTATGTLGVTLWTEQTGTLAPANNNSATVSLEAGQNGRYSFSGTAGQGIGLGVTNLAMTPSGSLTLKVYKPGNNTTPLYTCSMSSSALGGSCDPNPVSPQTLLPVDGTYTVFVDPGSAAATLTLWLTADKTGTLTPEVTQTFTSTRVGQNARYSFSGTAGQNLSLGFTGDTFPGTTWFYVYKPDNIQLAYTTLSNAVGGTTWNLVTTLPTNGTYTLFVTPSGTATGSINIQIP